MSDSPVSIIGDAYREEAVPSFGQPLPDPGTDPRDAPLACIHLSRSWLPLLAGASLQLLMPASWVWADDAALDSIMGRAVYVLEAIAFAEECPMAGSLDLTILAGSASVTGAVTFPDTFSSTPNVVVSGNTGTVICSASGASTTGFTARITANVVLGADHTEHVTWQAML